jgi:hypothetical protein
MKISVIISACDNREELFCRSLDTWANQSMSKNDFELIIIDDAFRENLKNLCVQSSKRLKLNIRFIRINKQKSIYPVKTFIPVLTNNIGFKQACGEVVVITGPETLQSSTNLEISYSMKNRKECAYGLIYKANQSASDYIAKGWSKLKNLSINHLLQIPGTQKGCVTKPPHPPAYWYYMTVLKQYVENIGGVDERFVGGLCAEDDDFANRMKMSGIIPIFEHSIIGIHQDHSRQDNNDGIHIDRKTGIGYGYKLHNFQIMQENLAKNIIVANTSHIWGDENLIILNEYYNGGA